MPYGGEQIKHSHSSQDYQAASSFLTDIFYQELENWRIFFEFIRI
jgi:hypothetical protein